MELVNGIKLKKILDRRGLFRAVRMEHVRGLESDGSGRGTKSVDGKCDGVGVDASVAKVGHVMDDGGVAAGTKDKNTISFLGELCEAFTRERERSKTTEAEEVALMFASRSESLMMALSQSVAVGEIIMTRYDDGLE